MKMKFALLLPLFFAFIATGCDKEDDDNGNNADYSPMAAGSSWTYQSEGGSTHTITATSKDTTINQKTFRVFTNSAGGNSYQARVGNDYFRYGELEGLPGMEELYLKDNIDINAGWNWAQLINVPGVPIPLNLNFAYLVKEKGISYTVLGKSYTDVIKVGLDVSITGLGPVGSGSFYYAKGVGMIENSFTIDFQGTVQTETQRLVSYQVQ